MNADNPPVFIRVHRRLSAAKCFSRMSERRHARLIGRTRVYDDSMTKPAGWGWVILAGLLGAVPISAQVLNTQSLSGKYYFRHISFSTDGRNPQSLTDARTLMGSIAFDGAGH